MEPLQPLDTSGLFPGIDAELLSLLGGLSPADWERPTVAGRWRVREVVAHLLDGHLRRLSVQRDGHQPPPPAEPIGGYGDLVRYLNELNAEWVRAAQRLSPAVLMSLLEWIGPQVAALFASLDPHGTAIFPVAWAGEERSENWMDVGREYTERWHHQAQIRDAVGAPGLLGRPWFPPLLDLSLRALPPAYAGTQAPEGSALAVAVAGEAGGVWALVREREGWRLWRGEPPAAAARVRMDGDTAWRLLYHALPAAAARERIAVEGDAALAEPLLAARSVMV